MPNLIYWVSQKFGFLEEKNPRARLEKRKKTGTPSLLAFVLTLLIAASGGIFGRWLGIPAGCFFFSLVAALIWKLSTGFSFLPKTLKRFAQILSGCCLGSGITLEGVCGMVELAIPMLIVAAVYTLNCFATGAVISKTCGFSKKEGMLIATPAGASDMVLIASDIGVQNTDVIVLQVVRAVVVMSFFPQMVAFILHAVESGHLPF